MTISRSDASRQLDGAGLRAKRALGQNFVVDANTVRKIARLANIDGHPRVLEIGAGLGSLTMALAEPAGHVTALIGKHYLVTTLTGCLLQTCHTTSQLH